MKINYRHKKMLLEDFYNKLDGIIDQKVILEIPIDIKKNKETILFSDKCNNSNLKVALDYNNDISEISVVKDGVKFIYSRRKLRIKKNTIEDLLKILRTDERLNGCYNILESQIAVIMNAKVIIQSKKVNTKKII